MRPKHPFFAQFAVWLILFQLLTPIAFAGFDITTVCSSDGIKQIAMDAQGNPVELPTVQEHCELCILYSPNAPIALADKAPTINSTQRNIHVTSDTTNQIITHSALGFSSRAPPYIA